MHVTTKNSFLNIEGRTVPYTELEVLGDKHTLSVRKYPKNISVKMWKNSNKSDTAVSLKMPHDKFRFWVHVSEIMENFDTELDSSLLDVIEQRWDELVKTISF